MTDELETTARQESKRKVYRIPIRQIVANTNPRNPLGEELRKRGFTVFGDVPPPRPQRPSLWEMATSESPADRKAFVDFMNTDEDFVAWAQTFLTQGQLEPVEVRDNGKRQDGTNTYTLVYGCRRCLAILYNWCLIGKPKEPMVEATLQKGNNATLLHRAVIENMRKEPNAIEKAKALQMAVNAGQTVEEVAKEYGVSEQTVKRSLSLLELPIEQQKKIEAGTLKVSKALAEKKETEPKQKERKQRPKKEIEKAMERFVEDSPIRKIFEWVLGRRENFS